MCTVYAVRCTILILNAVSCVGILMHTELPAALISDK